MSPKQQFCQGEEISVIITGMIHKTGDTLSSWQKVNICLILALINEKKLKSMC